MKRISLTQGKSTIVDDWNYSWLNQWKWWTQKHGKTFYAVRNVPGPNGKQLQIRMHRLILGIKNPKIEGDHWDGDGLNNREHNLRVATRTNNNQNQRLRIDNASGRKGVSWKISNKSWVVQIQVNGKKKHLGYFRDLRLAAECYDTAARKYFGAFAVLNFP
jgi:hypothetical protein